MMINPRSLAAAQLDDIQSRKILYSGDGYTVTLMHGCPGEGGAPHSHPHAQFVYVLSGAGSFRVGEEVVAVTDGQCLRIAPSLPHGIAKVDEEMTWLEFFAPERTDIK